MDILKNKEFLSRFWNLENEERPGFMIGYTGQQVIGGEPVVSALFSTEGEDNVRDRLLDPAKYLHAQLKEINSQIKLKGDYIPSLCPSLGVIAIASAFGCEVVWWEDDFPSVKSFVKDDPEEVFGLQIPTVTDGELGRILDYSRYFIEQTERKFPVRLTDIQGPLDNASLIMGHNNLLMATLSHPEAVHHLLQLITNLTIDFVKEQRRMVIEGGVEFIPAMFQPWLPDGMGISISNDDWVMISPEMHQIYHVPYLNMLSEEFGGIYLHSCGNWAHQFASIKKIHNVRGLEFGASEVPFREVLKVFNGNVPLVCRVGFNRDTVFHGMSDYVKQILEARKTNCGFFINVDITNGVLPDDWQVTDLNEIYRLMEIG